MNCYSHSDNELQGYKIRGYNRNFQPEQTKEPYHRDGGKTAAEHRQHDPPQFSENNT